MKPYKCKNKACAKVLGFASARIFEVGGIEVDHLFSFTCQSCKRTHVWKPVKADITLDTMRTAVLQS